MSASAAGRAVQDAEFVAVTSPDSRRCPDQAEVKFADSLGDSTWVCLMHAEQILVTVPVGLHCWP